MHCPHLLSMLANAVSQLLHHADKLLHHISRQALKPLLQLNHKGILQERLQKHATAAPQYDDVHSAAWMRRDASDHIHHQQQRQQQACAVVLGERLTHPVTCWHQQAKQADCWS
jgi:hypothetical protein